LNNWFELLQLRIEVEDVRLLLLLTVEALLCLKQGNSNRYNCLFLVNFKLLEEARIFENE